MRRAGSSQPIAGGGHAAGSTRWGGAIGGSVVDEVDVIVTGVVFCHQVTMPSRIGVTSSVFSSSPTMSERPSPSRSSTCASCVPRVSTRVRSQPSLARASPIRR
jgi:hypothetical protein